MSVIKRMRRQRAVLWRLGGVNHYGAPFFYPPTEIKCRWEDGSEEFRDAQGVAFTYQCTVYVDQHVNIGDMLRFGEMESDINSDPIAAGAKAVQRSTTLPNFRCSENLYMAYL